MTVSKPDSEDKRAAQPADQRPLTPLWMIAMFVTFSEAVLGLAVTKTSGNVQMALTLFVISFPIMVAVAFFAILWSKPWHFYAPHDYANVDAPQFMNALRGELADRVNRLENSLTDLLMATVLDAYEYVTLRKIAGPDQDQSYRFNQPEGQDLLERLRNRGLIEQKSGVSIFKDRSDRVINVRDLFIITSKGAGFLRAIDERGLGNQLEGIIQSGH